jgi:hypothetical protein
MVGLDVTTCNCAWGCPCQFNALPTHGQCEALVAMRIREGHYGATTLDGLTFASAWWWPGAVHEGNGVVQLAIDEKATPEQRRALLNIASGKEGCAFFEIFASTVSKVVDPLFVPIDFESDQEQRTARLKVPGLGEFRIEPIKNPVTGQPHRARIDLPEGFEYRVAEIGNCVEHRATFADKTLSNENCHAHFALVDWSNA